MPPKKKACKVRHVDEVAAPEHGPRQCQERERSITPNGEIGKVANKIYARMLEQSEVMSIGGRVVPLGSSISKALQLLMVSLT